MSKKHIMGSKPGKDPVEQWESSGFSVTTDTSIKWESRKLQQSWTIPTVVTILSFVGVFVIPLLVIILTIIFIPSVLVVWFINSSTQLTQEGSWRKVDLRKLDLEPSKRYKTVRIQSDIPIHLTGTSLKMMGVKTGGSLSSLIRSVQGEHGFLLNVGMSLADPNEVIEGELLHKNIHLYLKNKGENGRFTYMDYHGELWKTKVNVIGAMSDESEARSFRNTIRGAIPSKNWSDMKPDQIVSSIDGLRTLDATPGYYLVGRELSEWLVELSSLLTGEVGMSIPSQFVADIKTRPADYLLGNVINPDTLRNGPMTGISAKDIEKGMMICGGTKEDRWNVTGLLTQTLIADGKRVIIISSHPDSLRLTGLHESGLGLTLGRDLILNPMDSEGIHRSVYVTQLLSALEVFTEATLTATPDLELALNNAVALSNSTVADVQLVRDETLETRGTESSHDMGNKNTRLGLDAVRRLHHGGGAKAFYGTQTIQMQKLAQQDFSIISLALGDNTLDNFAWDLIMMKLGGITPDKNLIIILDDPVSLRYMFKRYGKRETWVERLMRNLSDKFSLIVSIDRPSDMGGGITNLFDSCISFRLTREDDIATVSSSLALQVIGSGLHSKARWSARESSYLRTMPDGTALIVHNATETAQPVRITQFQLPARTADEELKSRLSTITPTVHVSAEETPRTLIGHVGGSDQDLALKILRLLERYEPLTEESVRRFIQASSTDDIDVEGVLIRLREASLVMEGHEQHSGTAYKNYRLTLKGTMALRQSETLEGSA